MAMIEFEDHSEENQKALLAYLSAGYAHWERKDPRGGEWRRLLARLAKWVGGLLIY